MNEFFLREDWLLDTIYEMLKSTGRKKKPTSHDTTTEDASVREAVVAFEAEVVNNER